MLSVLFLNGDVSNNDSNNDSLRETLGSSYVGLSRPEHRESLQRLVHFALASTHMHTVVGPDDSVCLHEGFVDGGQRRREQDKTLGEPHRHTLKIVLHLKN